jgi:hypothetical protein
MELIPYIILSRAWPTLPFAYLSKNYFGPRPIKNLLLQIYNIIASYQLRVLSPNTQGKEREY